MSIKFQTLSEENLNLKRSISYLEKEMYNKEKLVGDYKQQLRESSNLNQIVSGQYQPEANQYSTEHLRNYSNFSANSGSNKSFEDTSFQDQKISKAAYNMKKYSRQSDVIEESGIQKLSINEQATSSIQKKMQNIIPTNKDIVKNEDLILNIETKLLETQKEKDIVAF